MLAKPERMLKVWIAGQSSHRLVGDGGEHGGL